MHMYKNVNIVYLKIEIPGCCTHSLLFPLSFRSASSSPLTSQTSPRMPRTWCSGWSAAGSAGWARTASRNSRNTPFSLALTGRTFVALKPLTFLTSALPQTPPTLMWMMMYWKTRLVFHFSCLSNFYGSCSILAFYFKSYLLKFFIQDF